MCACEVKKNRNLPAWTNLNFFFWKHCANYSKVIACVCGCADAASWSLSFMRCQRGVQRGRSTVALGGGGSEVNALWMCAQASVRIRS